MLYIYSQNLYGNNYTYSNSSSKRQIINAYFTNNKLNVTNVENIAQEFDDPDQVRLDDDWEPPEDPE